MTISTYNNNHLTTSLYVQYHRDHITTSIHNQYSLTEHSQFCLVRDIGAMLNKGIVCPAGIISNVVKLEVNDCDVAENSDVNLGANVLRHGYFRNVSRKNEHVILQPLDVYREGESKSSATQDDGATGNASLCHRVDKYDRNNWKEQGVASTSNKLY